MYDKVWKHKQHGNGWIKITAHSAKTTASSWPQVALYERKKN